jgi:hypothetical protein
MFWDYVYARYRSEYDRITVIHHDFVEATECSFWKVIVILIYLPRYQIDISRIIFKSS